MFHEIATPARSNGWLRRAAFGMVIGVIATLCACSQSPEDKLMDIGECYKAGKTFNDQEMVFGVHLRLEELMQEVGSQVSNKSALFMQFNERVNDKLYPRGVSSSPEEALRLLNEWHDSERCQPMRTPMPKPPPKVRPTVVVPQIDGVCRDPKQELINAHLVPDVITLTGNPNEPDAGKAGCAYRQNPAPGTSVPEGSKVTFRMWMYSPEDSSLE